MSAPATRHRALSLGVCVARMRKATDEFNRAWRDAIQLMAPPPPFDEMGASWNREEETLDYAADEDEWPGNRGGV